ncbi:hypothetical protein [Deinococcus sp. QL22]|uniref:hypothetical protein n=1 Tax=Deinococcus sp. QL22 TaxID=2939437 RepID=UPI002017B5A0|nr:hypothetical protein [Deinococcus sp. QL22]UQN09786.1 hypothetical protein M1R55_25295 [Deinococcus sp. QL22]
MHPADEHAQKLTLALRKYDLDHLIALLPDLSPSQPKHVLRAHLKFVFEQAQKDKLDLLHPPADFHTWLQEPLRRTRTPEKQAQPNTVHARATLLTRLYRLLQEEGLIQQQPLLGLPRPTVVPTKRLPHPDTLHRLHLQTQPDPALHGALMLIHHLAFTTGELIALQWEHVDFPRNQLLRRRTASPLPELVRQALDRLAEPQGGPLYAAGKVFPYANDQAFRQALWQASKDANTELVPPATLRLAGLHANGQHLTPIQAGFIDDRAFDDARALVKALSAAEE